MNFFIDIPFDVLTHILDCHLVYGLRMTNKVIKNYIDGILYGKYIHFKEKIPPPYQLKVEYNLHTHCNATTARNMYKMKTSQLDVLDYIHGRGNTRLYNTKDIILTSMENFKYIKDLYDYHIHRKQKIDEKNRIQTKLQMEKMEEKFKNSITSIVSYHSDPQNSTFRVV